MLCVTDQRRDAKKASGGGIGINAGGKRVLRKEALLSPDRTPEKFLWCPFVFRRINLRIAGPFDTGLYFPYSGGILAAEDRYAIVRIRRSHYGTEGADSRNLGASLRTLPLERG
jgi:hypothetical protein